MWRAVRLVIDTGMHYKHWTRQQAIDYFLAHAATTEYNAISEVDRYISWPGQALAYKMGSSRSRNYGSAPKKNWDRNSTFALSTMSCCWTDRYPTVLEKEVNAWIATHKTGNVGAGALNRPAGQSSTVAQSPN